jgi:hypothetical protein
MRYLPLLFVAILLFPACRHNARMHLPPGLTADSVITEKEMIGMLVDVHLLEAALQVSLRKNENTDRMKRFYYHALYTQHHMSEDRFRKNIAYYQQDPENFSRMYEDVIKIIESRNPDRKK